MRGLSVVDLGAGPEIAWYADGRHNILGRPVQELPALLATLPTGPEADPRVVPPPMAGRPATAPQILPPLAPGARIVAVAQNYPAHAAEAGGESPGTPVMFIKPHSAFVGPDTEVTMPAVTAALDYEAELAAVVGRELRDADEAEALAGIAGYCLANDGSARDLQPTVLANKPIVDWFSAKCLDGCSALGPVIVPADDIGDITGMRLVGTLNGTVVQDDQVSSMHVGIGALLSFVSARMALQPGDVVLTGTPAGVGKARGRLLRDGDVFTVSMDGLGELRTTYAS